LSWIPMTCNTNLKWEPIFLVVLLVSSSANDLKDLIWSYKSFRIKLDSNSSLWWCSNFDPLVDIGTIEMIEQAFSQNKMYLGQFLLFCAQTWDCYPHLYIFAAYWVGDVVGQMMFPKFVLQLPSGISLLSHMLFNWLPILWEFTEQNLRSTFRTIIFYVVNGNTAVEGVKLSRNWWKYDVLKKANCCSVDGIFQCQLFTCNSPPEWIWKI
jgi:hypothetical protein